MPLRFPTANFRSPAALARFIIPAVVGVTLDLWSKHEAYARLKVGERIDPLGRVQVISRTYRLIPDWLHIELTNNYGAVFGAGQGLRWFFLSVSVAAIVALIWLFAAAEKRFRLYQFVLGMLLAGVVGNLHDRAVVTYVRDMIHALPKWGVFPWIFNVADSLLCVGVGLVMLHIYRNPKPTK